MINEEVSRQAIAIVESGNIKSAKMVIDLMKKMLNMVAKKGKSLKEFIEEKKPTTVKDLVKKGKVIDLRKEVEQAESVRICIEKLQQENRELTQAKKQELDL